jgi:hypothetical protein
MKMPESAEFQKIKRQNVRGVRLIIWISNRKSDLYDIKNHTGRGIQQAKGTPFPRRIMK